MAQTTVGDLDKVQGSACRASAKMKSLLSPGIKKSPKGLFWWTKIMFV